MTTESETDLARVADIVRSAKRLVVLTGAGISAESGVPTFRGADGLWKSHQPEQLATPEAFNRDPRLVWEWYSWRRELIAACAPNEGHRAIARLQADSPSTCLVTQNVDGLHERALKEMGVESSRQAPTLLELHGSLFRNRCTGCSSLSSHRVLIEGDDDASLPCCADCGALLRPDVVWFGESLDPVILNSAIGAARSGDVCLVVGTSAVVQPAASFPLLTLESGGVVIEVNPKPTPLSAAALEVVRGPAAWALPRILADAAADARVTPPDESEHSRGRILDGR